MNGLDKTGKETVVSIDVVEPYDFELSLLWRIDLSSQKMRLKPGPFILLLNRLTFPL